jgi:membrane protein YdbS with pleckstrin-like domain
LPGEALPEYRPGVPFPKRLLSQKEELILDLRPHWIALVGPVVLALLILGGMIAALAYMPASWPGWMTWAVIVVALAALAAGPLPIFVRWATSHFVVTSDRLIHRSGWLAKKSMEIPLEKISDVRFNQTVFERVIGAGDLTIESPGEFGQEKFSDIRRPEHVQKVIYEMGETNQRRMMTPEPAPAPAATPHVHVEGASVSEELAKLGHLRDAGVLSEAEFQAEKARLLNRG